MVKFSLVDTNKHNELSNRLDEVQQLLSSFHYSVISHKDNKGNMLNFETATFKRNVDFNELGLKPCSGNDHLRITVILRVIKDPFETLRFNAQIGIEQENDNGERVSFSFEGVNPLDLVYNINHYEDKLLAMWKIASENAIPAISMKQLG